MKKSRPYLITLAAAEIMGFQACSPESRDPEKMNVLFIVADDLRPDLYCYGNKEIVSPNIDALARQGCLFSHQFVQVATCGASRSCLMTGRFPHNMKALSNNAFEPFKQLRNSGVKPDMNDTASVVTLPDLFKLNGYTTVAVGKVSHLAKKGDMPGSWDREFNYLNVSKFPEQKIETGNLKARLTAKLIDAPDSAFTDGLVTGRAILELRELKASGKPFFLGVGFHLPHLPFYAPKKYWDLYDREKLKLPGYSNAPTNCDPAISLHNNFEIRGQYTQLNVPDSVTETRILRHGYYACISYIDVMLGQIMAELDRLDLRKNTVIVFWGDNGFHLGDYGIWGKHTCFEYSMRTPLIISFPEMKMKGTICEGIVEEVDIYPTLADICKLALPAGIDGKSMVPLLTEPALPGKKFARGFLPEGEWRKGDEPYGCSVRTERYRLVKWYDRETLLPINYVELYDLINDPGETVNIAEANQEVIKALGKWIIPVQSE